MESLLNTPRSDPSDPESPGQTFVPESASDRLTWATCILVVITVGTLPECNVPLHQLRNWTRRGRRQAMLTAHIPMPASAVVNTWINTLFQARSPWILAACLTKKNLAGAHTGHMNPTLKVRTSPIFFLRSRFCRRNTRGMGGTRFRNRWEGLFHNRCTTRSPVHGPYHSK